MIRETLYQVLGVPASASTNEIEAGYQRALAVLEASENRMNREDYDFRRTLILLARDTLSDPVSRMGYDEKLMARRGPGTASADRKGAIPTPISARLPAPDRLSQGADAPPVRTRAVIYHTDANEEAGGLGSFRASSFSLSSHRSSPFRSLLAIMLIVVILAIMLQSYLVYSSRVERAYNEKLAAATANAEEKLIIQDYYHKYGERLASADEARRRDLEHRQREAEALQAERERTRAEREAQQRQEADRRYADRVSFDLRRAEEAERREAEREEKRAQEEAQRKQREEAERTERMQQHWRSVMQPSQPQPSKPQ